MPDNESNKNLTPKTHSDIRYETAVAWADEIRKLFANESHDVVGYPPPTTKLEELVEKAMILSEQRGAKMTLDRLALFVNQLRQGFKAGMANHVAQGYKHVAEWLVGTTVFLNKKDQDEGLTSGLLRREPSVDEAKIVTLPGRKFFKG